MFVFCLQVGFDPAGHGDSEESWGFIQRTDREGDPDVPAQVKLHVSKLDSVSCVLLSWTWHISFWCSWAKVTEHLADRNMPVLHPGTKVRIISGSKRSSSEWEPRLSRRCKGTDSRHESSCMINVWMVLCFITEISSSSSWKTKNDKWLKTNSRWCFVLMSLTKPEPIKIHCAVKREISKVSDFCFLSPRGLSGF